MPAFDIEIRKETKKHRISLKKIEEVTAGILKELGWKHLALSLLLVGDRKIRSINRQFLKHDYATDVIAFGYAPPKQVLSSLKRQKAKRVSSKDMQIILGDIAISLDTAKRVAKEQKHSFSYEVYFYICHGILHLMGYDDKTEAQRKRMWKKQEALLKKVGVGR